MVRAYCLHCKRERDVDDARLHRERDGANRVSGKCRSCRRKVSAFVKNHRGGATIIYKRAGNLAFPTTMPRC